MINLLNLLVNNFININSTNIHGVPVMSDYVLGNGNRAINKYSLIYHNLDKVQIRKKVT